MDNIYDVNTKDDLIYKLSDFAVNPDDDCIRCKEKIKNALLNCPELLYLFHEKDYEKELFLPSGELNTEGDWDVYYGDNIRPYLYIPETQENIKHYLSYRVMFDSTPLYNKVEKYLQIVFYIFVNGQDAIESTTGLCRHDLIASMLREKFNWTNIFGTQCRLVSNIENITDNYFLTRTLTLECNVLNSIVKTNSNKTSVINNLVRTNQLADILEFDELRLYFGEDTEINKYIKLRSPSVGDVVEYGEREYYSTLHLLTAIPSDMKSQLFDIGIDYEAISDFELFYLLTRNLKPEKTSIFFYDLDLSSFELTQNKENDKLIMRQPDSDIVIDELAYKKIAGCLCKIHGIVPKIEHAANKTTKKILIDLDRQRLAKMKNVEYKSSLKYLISAMMRYPGFKYKTNELKQCSMYEFMDEVQGAQIYTSSIALLQGSYSGMVDTSKIDKKQFNWMRDLTEK